MFRCWRSCACAFQFGLLSILTVAVSALCLLTRQALDQVVPQPDFTCLRLTPNPPSQFLLKRHQRMQLLITAPPQAPSMHAVLSYSSQLLLKRHQCMQCSATHHSSSSSAINACSAPTHALGCTSPSPPPPHLKNPYGPSP